MAQQLLAYPEYRVVATARNPSSLADLEGGDDRLLTTALEVTSKESRDAAVAAALAKFGRIDVFVNNAGQAFHSDSEQSCPEEERQQFDVNFWGPMELTRHAVRVMREENPKNGPIGGVIINVTSFVGFVSIPGCPFYCASKFALEGFTETFAKEVHPDWNSRFYSSTSFAVMIRMGAKEKRKKKGLQLSNGMTFTKPQFTFASPSPAVSLRHSRTTENLGSLIRHTRPPARRRESSRLGPRIYPTWASRRQRGRRRPLSRLCMAPRRVPGAASHYDCPLAQIPST